MTKKDTLAVHYVPRWRRHGYKAKEAVIIMSRWKKEDIFTIPNILSVVRLALIPVFLWLYCKKQEYGWAVGIVLLSGFTDVLDGFIARRFDMVSDLGKILDPAADKLTQLALIISLATRYGTIWYLLGLFVLKEVTMGVMGLLVVLKTHTVPSARWFGKACTAVLEASMGIMILFPALPPGMVEALVLVSGCMLVFSFVQYIIMDVRLIRTAGRMKDA